MSRYIQPRFASQILKYSWTWTSAEPLAQTFEENLVLCAGVMLHQDLEDVAN